MAYNDVIEDKALLQSSHSAEEQLSDKQGFSSYLWTCLFLEKQKQFNKKWVNSICMGH